MAPGDFLRALFERGQVRVPPVGAATAAAADWATADAVLAEWERAGRLEFPGSPPDFDLAAARWAAEQFYRACQFVVYRDAPAAVLDAALNAPCPAAPGPSQHYSVDLVFRFLPDLLRHAAGAARQDPLCYQLRGWARQWPLSSVGIANVEVADIGAISAHAGLLRLYADRIVARSDTRRLADARARAAVRAALGDYADLAPALAAALAAEDPAAAE